MLSRLHKVLAGRLDRFGLAPSELLQRDAPGGLGEPGDISANGQCRIVAARGGWIALNLARPDDFDVIPALTGLVDDPWSAVAAAARDCAANDFRDRAAELQLPVAVVGESGPQPLATVGGGCVPRKVVDLAALWAGPLCAGLLARAGAPVVRIESLGRPDPTAVGSPLLNARINAGKTRLALDLRTAEGRAALLRELADAEVLVTSARPAALARLGLEPRRFPQLTWVAITGHGFDGPGATRVGFGDDCAAAGGLLRREQGEPRFLSDALADPLTGLEAALAVLAGHRGVIDMAMARVAAAYAGMLA